MNYCGTSGGAPMSDAPRRLHLNLMSRQAEAAPFHPNESVSSSHDVEPLQMEDETQAMVNAKQPHAAAYRADIDGLRAVAVGIVVIYRMRS